MAHKTRFLIEGYIERTDIGFDEEVCAYSEAQAKRFLHFRLQRRYPGMRVFLIYAHVTALPITSGIARQTEFPFLGRS